MPPDCLRHLNAVLTDGQPELLGGLFHEFLPLRWIEILHAMEPVFFKISIMIPVARMPDVRYERKSHEFERDISLHSQNTRREPVIPPRLSQAKITRWNKVENPFIEKKYIDAVFEYFTSPAFKRFDVGPACQQQRSPRLFNHVTN